MVNPRPLASYRVGTGASVTANLEGMARTNQATYRLALERGNLDPKQQKIAQRHLRFYEALEELAASGPTAARSGVSRRRCRSSC